MTTDVQWRAPDAPAVPEVLNADEWTPQEAAAYVSAGWQSTVASIVDTGERLIEAKRRVRYGRWAEAVSQMPIGDRTIRALMQIARHPDLANRQHVAVLPASWGTLAVLAQLPPGEIPTRVEAKEITPELERKTALEWAQVYQLAKQEAINAYVNACDGLRIAAGWANTYQLPDDLPDSCPSPEWFEERVAVLSNAVRSWKESQ